VPQWQLETVGRALDQNCTSILLDYSTHSNQHRKVKPSMRSLTIHNLNGGNKGLALPRYKSGTHRRRGSAAISREIEDCSWLSESATIMRSSMFAIAGCICHEK